MNNTIKKIVASVMMITVAGIMFPSGAQAITAAELQEQIDALLAQLTTLQAQLAELEGEEAAPAVEGCTITSFDQNLKQGMSGDDVKCLQIVLNSDTDTQLADSGVGSPGNETSYFGPLTQAAVVKFQEKYADEVLASWGLTSGTGFVGSTTRAKLNELLGALPAEEEEEEVVPTENTVSLSSDTPAAGVVAAGAQDVVFTKVKFTAGSEAYTITAISVLRGGVSADANLSSVKLYDGTTRVGSSQAINTNTHKALFSNLTWVIPANSTKTLTIKGSVASTASAGNSIVLGISVLTDITSTGIIAGTFPINGNAKTVATQAVGALTADMLATPSASSPISGSIEQHVGTLQLTASTTEGFDINSIKLTQVGTAGDADVLNVKLKYGATLLGTVANVTTASVTFTGSPIINIPVNSSKNLDIYVDVAPGLSTARTIIWEVTQAADIEAIGANSGGLVTVSPAATWPEQGATHTISRGALTIALDTATNPSAQNYVIGTTGRDITALKFSAGSTEGVRVTQLTLTLSGTGSATDISNVALYSDGVLIAGPSGISGTTVQFGVNTINTFDTTGLFDVAASANKVIMVRADIPSGASSSATVALSIASAANVKADGLLSEMDIAAASITGTATGNAHTITASGSLSVSLNANSPAAQTVAKGVAGKEIAKYSLTAGSGEDIIVSTIILRLYKDSAASGTVSVSGDITDVSLWDGSTQLGITVASPGATASFNANLTVPAGTVKVVTVKATVPTGTTASSIHADLEAADTAGDMVSTGAGSLASITETGNARGNLMTIGTPSLAVAASSVPVAASYVTGSTGVTMTNLLLTAGTAENVKVSSLQISFAATDTLATTSTASAQFSNVKLMDGTTQYGSTMQITDATPDYAKFSGINNLTIAAGQTKQISVVLDIVGTTGTWYSGQAASGDVIGSGEVSGTSATSTGGVQAGTALTIASSGSSTVAVAADTPVSANIAVGNTEGAAGVTFSKIKFTSTIEAVKMSRIMLTRSGGADTDFAAVYLYDGTTKLATSYMNNGSTTFNFSAGNEIIVPKTSDLVITVKADLNAINSGVTHADAPILYIASTTGDIDSTGKDSQTAIVETVGSPSPETSSNLGAMTLYKTTATASLNASSPSGASVAGATQEVLRVDVTNNGLYDLTVVSFDVTPTYSGTVSTSTVTTKLYWSSDLSTVVATGTNLGTAGSGTKITLSPTSNNTVGAGVTKTLVVKADTTGLTTNNALHMDLAAVADFGWTPAGGSEVTTLTKNLPIIGGTLTY